MPEKHLERAGAAESGGEGALHPAPPSGRGEDQCGRPCHGNGGCTVTVSSHGPLQQADVTQELKQSRGPALLGQRFPCSPAAGLDVREVSLSCLPPCSVSHVSLLL